MKIPRKIGIFFIAAMMIVPFIFPTNGMAASINAFPSVAIEETWDSNIYNDSDNETSDFILRVSPGVTILFGLFHTTMSLSGGFEFERYAEHSDLDEDSNTKNFGLEVAEPFQITPRFFLLPSASFLETTDSIKRNPSQGQPSTDSPPPDLVVTERAKYRDYNASLQMTYLVSPKVDLSVGGGVKKRDYVNDNTTSNLEDFRTITGSFSVMYRHTPRFAPGIFFSTSKNEYDVSPTSWIYSGGITAHYLIAQHWTLDAQVGASYLKESADATGQTNESWGPLVSSVIAYTKQYFQLTVSGYYGFTGSGSLGETTKSGTLSITMKDQFAERWWWDLNGSYQNNQSVNDSTNNNDENVDIFSGLGGIRYSPVEWASISLSGNIIRQRSNGLSGDDIDRELITLGITMGKYSNIY